MLHKSWNSSPLGPERSLPNGESVISGFNWLCTLLLPFLYQFLILSTHRNQVSVYLSECNVKNLSSINNKRDPLTTLDPEKQVFVVMSIQKWMSLLKSECLCWLSTLPSSRGFFWSHCNGGSASWGYLQGLWLPVAYVQLELCHLQPLVSYFLPQSWFLYLYIEKYTVSVLQCFVRIQKIRFM